MPLYDLFAQILKTMLPQKPFYLIRHGQSEANVRHITAGGQFDSPLSPLGHEQARTLAPYLAQLADQPARVVHSPMIRARDTAQYLNRGLNLQATGMADLREHEMGIWDGLPWDDVLPMLEARMTPPGGETPAQFAQRIQSILTDILNGGDGLPFIVAHGGLFHAIGFLYEYGMDQVQNCHLHYFEPYPEFDTFPWRVWIFDIEGEKLVRRPAPFCLSVALERQVAM